MTSPLRALTLFATSAAVLANPAAALQLGTFEAHRPEHVRLLHAEREARLREDWVRVGDARRRLALDLIHARRRPGEPAGARVSFETLADVACILDGGDPEAAHRPWSERMVRSLDLRVVPGVFAARDEGRGESMVVRVESLYALPAPEGIEELPIVLTWLGPAGEELQARAEPVPTTCLTRTGFEMFVRPPVSEPGRWHLVAEVGHGAARRRGVEVAVDCVGDLGARARRLQLESQRAPSVLRSELWAAVGQLREHGLRRLATLFLGHWFDFSEERPPATLTAPVVPSSLGSAALAQGPVFWTLPNDGPFERALVIVCGTAEHPSEVLSGAVGEGWRRLSVARATRVLVCAPSPGVPARLMERCASLASERGWSEVHLMARGDQGTALLAEVQRRDSPPIAGLILCATPGAGPRDGAGLAVPLLTIDALAAQETSAEGEGWSRIGCREPGFLLDLRVPSLVAAWLPDLP